MSSTTSSHTSTVSPILNEGGEDAALLHSPQNPQRLLSFCLTIILLFLYPLYLVVFIPFQFYCTSSTCAYAAYSAINYSNIALYLITILVMSIINLELEWLLRRGYGRFYNDVNSLIKVPIFIFSLGNIAMLTYMLILNDLGVRMKDAQEFDKDDHRLHNESKRIYTFFIGFQVIVFIEILVSLYFLFVLAVKLLRFEALRRRPDILADEFVEWQENEDGLNVAPSDPAMRDEMVTELQQRRIDFLLRRNRQLVRGIRHVITNLPKELRTASERSLQQYFEGYSDDDTKDGIGDDINDDDCLINV